MFRSHFRLRLVLQTPPPAHFATSAVRPPPPAASSQNLQSRQVDAASIAASTTTTSPSTSSTTGTNTASTKISTLPSGSNLSTVTAFSLGLQLSQFGQTQSLSNSIASSGNYTNVTNSYTAANEEANNNNMKNRKNNNNNNSAAYQFPSLPYLVDPLSWKLPSSSSSIRVQDSIEALQSPALTLAPLPLDAAVLCLGVSIESAFFSSSSSSNQQQQQLKNQIASAVWNYPLGAGKLLSRFTETLQSRPTLIYSHFGDDQHQQKKKASQKLMTARSISAALVEIVEMILANEAKKIVSSTSNNNTKYEVYYGAILADETKSPNHEFLKAAVKIVKLSHQTSRLAEMMNSTNNSTSDHDDDYRAITDFHSSFLGAAADALGIAARTPTTTELPAFAAVCELFGALYHTHASNNANKHNISFDSVANSLLGAFGKALQRSNNKNSSNIHSSSSSSASPVSSFYIDTGDGLANLMMALTFVADPSRNDFADSVLILWNSLAQYTRASSGDVVVGNAASRCRSAVVGCLAKQNRFTEAFEHEAKMASMSLVLEPSVQVMLIRSVVNYNLTSNTTSSSSTDNNSNSKNNKSSPSVENSTRFVLRRELQRLNTIAREHWSFSSPSASSSPAEKNKNTDNDTFNMQTKGSSSTGTTTPTTTVTTTTNLHFDVRLSLLQLCWESQYSGRILTSLARSFFPRSFVLGQLQAKDVTTFNPERLAKRSTMLHLTPHEILCALLRSLTLMNETNRVVFKPTKNSNNNDTTTKEETDEQGGKNDVKTLSEELTLLSNAALEVVGSGVSEDADAELWGCVIGAAAACASRQLLVDSALALKSAQPSEQFIESVMLTAIDCLQSRHWKLSKLVVAELARALGGTGGGGNAISDKVLSRILTRQQEQQQQQKKSSQQKQQEADNKTTSTTTGDHDDIAAIAKEFFGV